MSEQFVMKAAVALFVIGLGVLVLWANRVHERDSDDTKKMRGSGWEGNLDEMRGGAEK